MMLRHLDVSALRLNYIDTGLNLTSFYFGINYILSRFNGAQSIEAVLGRYGAPW